MDICGYKTTIIEVYPNLWGLLPYDTILIPMNNSKSAKYIPFFSEYKIINTKKATHDINDNDKSHDLPIFLRSLSALRSQRSPRPRSVAEWSEELRSLAQRRKTQRLQLRQAMREDLRLSGPHFFHVSGNAVFRLYHVWSKLQWCTTNLL